MSTETHQSTFETFTRYPFTYAGHEFASFVDPFKDGFVLIQRMGEAKFASFNASILKKDSTITKDSNLTSILSELDRLNEGCSWAKIALIESSL